MAKLLKIRRGDDYPCFDESYKIRLVDKGTTELTSNDLTGCTATLRIQDLFVEFPSEEVETKELVLQLTAEQTRQLRPTIKPLVTYLQIQTPTGKVKTKITDIQVIVEDEVI